MSSHSASEIDLTRPQADVLARMPIALVGEPGTQLLPLGVDGQAIADLRALGLIRLHGRGRKPRVWIKTTLGEAVETPVLPGARGQWGTGG